LRGIAGYVAGHRQKHDLNAPPRLPLPVNLPGKAHPKSTKPHTGIGNRIARMNAETKRWPTVAVSPAGRVPLLRGYFCISFYPPDPRNPRLVSAAESRV